MPNQEATNQNNQTQGGSFAPTETVLMKQIFDPNTGRTTTVDQNGRRVTPRRDMTGTQLVRINNMRNQAGLGYLKDHNVAMMSIDSASLMIDDMLHFIAREKMQRDTFYSMQAQIEHLQSTVDTFKNLYPQYVDAVQKRQNEDAQKASKK
jgi:hypothetical protein